MTEAKTGEEIPSPKTRLFIKNKKDSRLQSAVSFVQYAINLIPTELQVNNRLLTLIGETHDLTFECAQDKKSTTVAKYTFNILKQNEYATALLEIDPNFIDIKELWPHSAPIRELLDLAQGSPDILKRIVGYDWRNYWIRADKREVLYQDPTKFLTFTQDEILQYYIKPYTLKIQKDAPFWIDPSRYDPKTYSFLTIAFPDDLNIMNKGISDLILKKWDTDKSTREKILFDLKHFWKKVTDWNILKQVFYISDTDSIIAIMGEAHRENMSDIFKNQVPLINLKGRKNKCISLFETRYLENVSRIGNKLQLN